MNYGRITFAALAGTVVHFFYGGIVFGARPWLRSEFARVQPCIVRRKR